MPSFFLVRWSSLALARPWACPEYEYLSQRLLVSLAYCSDGLGITLYASGDLLIIIAVVSTNIGVYFRLDSHASQTVHLRMRRFRPDLTSYDTCFIRSSSPTKQP